MENIKSKLRWALGKYNGEEMTFSGKIKRKGESKLQLDIPYLKARTLLLENLCMKGEWVHDHIWINEREIVPYENFTWEDFKPGLHIKFLGTVYMYITDVYSNKLNRNSYNYGIGNIKVIDMHYNRKIGCYKGWL